MKVDSKKVKEFLERGVAESIVATSVSKKLLSGKKLRIKHGVDPTTKDLHLGYVVVYEKLRQLQEMGHTIVFLIGNFTGRFGDPTSKLESRSMRSKQDVEKLAKDYLNQLGKILDVSKVEVRYNGDWYDKMSAEDLLHLMSNFTVARMLERDMFARRMKEGKEIGLHEPVYPVLQGYDSVMLKSDLTVIGTDQLFNELQARPLQEAVGQAPQDIIATPLLIGTDGTKKMSQSLDNYIGMNESPNNVYGKVMSIPDKLMPQYYELATRVPFKEVKDIIKSLTKGQADPRDLKMRLAREIVTMLHSSKDAETAEANFVRVFQEHKAPDKIPLIKLKKKFFPLAELLMESGLVKSKGEAKRAIMQGGVKVDNKVIKDPQKEIILKPAGVVIQKGKRHFIRVKN